MKHLLRLVGMDGSVKEYELRPGVNSFGRNDAAHHVIDDGSVSGLHCEISLTENSLVVRDLGSTNGTFIDGRRITQSELLPGQNLRLGSVSMTLEVQDMDGVSESPRLSLRVPPPSVRVAPASDTATPSVPLRAIPILRDLEPPKNFFQLLPGTLSYPFGKNGIILLIVGALVFLVLEFLAQFSFLISIITTGYLFAYMQRIISSSAQGEREMPDFPEFSEWWSDILLPFLLFTWTVLACFGPAILLMVLGNKEDPVVWFGSLGLQAAGGICFPMALLAVAVTDNFLAVNPLVVLPSIFRVIGPYVVVCLMLALLVALRMGGQIMVSALPIPVFPSVIMGFFSLYLLAVEMRILGLLYQTQRERLRWLT